jgi:hypothetical protein
MHIISVSRLHRFILFAHLENGRYLPAKPFELLRVQALGTVTQRLLRLMVDFHHEPVSVGRHCRTGKWQNLISSTGGVAGIHDYRAGGSPF